ncbi:MAG: hypothetical protein HOZ81_13525 [Streptomyces sp.]|nr:hypothetical protein [Streptomyces sp.]
MNTYTFSLLQRPEAVRAIADTLADRTAYLITLPPGAAPLLAPSLDGIDGWTAYLDNGSGDVLATSDTGILCLAQAECLSSGAVRIPKSVHLDVISQIIRHRVPTDGSKDVFILTSKGGQPAYWPLLLVDAIDQVDAVMAARLRAHGVREGT